MGTKHRWLVNDEWNMPEVAAVSVLALIGLGPGSSAHSGRGVPPAQS